MNKTLIRGSGIRSRGALRGVIAAAALIAGVLVFAASPASANGQGSWLCGRDQAWSGYSYSGQAKTWATTSYGQSDCGTKYVRAYVGIQGHYGWTGWKSSSTLAVVSAGGGTIWNGQHKVKSCGLVYTCGPFST